MSAYTCKNVGVSRTFPIMYKREEVELHDVKLFKVYLLVDSHRVCIGTRLNFIELLERKIFLNKFLLSTNEQDTK